MESRYIANEIKRLEEYAKMLEEKHIYHEAGMVVALIGELKLKLVELAIKTKLMMDEKEEK